MKQKTQSQETQEKNSTETRTRCAEYSTEGIIFDVGSLCASYSRLVDGRKARGKRYSLVTMLLLMTLAKLCGQDTPEAMADWARQRCEALAEMLKLKRSAMPHATTYERLIRQAILPEDFEREMGPYARRGGQFVDDTPTLALHSSLDYLGPDEVVTQRGTISTVHWFRADPRLRSVNVPQKVSLRE